MVRKQVCAVGAFIFDRYDRVFLAKFTTKFQKKWSIPGGKIAFGESPDEAVRREVKEETNLDIVSVNYLKHGAFTVDDCHVVYIDFLAACSEPFEVNLNEEFSQWGFFSRDQLDELDIIPATKETVLLLIQQRCGEDLAVQLAKTTP